jgi:hypothetical protein
VLFAVSAIVGRPRSARAFQPPRLIWDLDQQLYLTRIYLLLAGPFFAARRQRSIAPQAEIEGVI